MSRIKGLHFLICHMMCIQLKRLGGLYELHIKQCYLRTRGKERYHGVLTYYKKCGSYIARKQTSKETNGIQGQIFHQPFNMVHSKTRLV